MKSIRNKLNIQLLERLIEIRHLGYGDNQEHWPIVRWEWRALETDIKADTYIYANHIR